MGCACALRSCCLTPGMMSRSTTEILRTLTILIWFCCEEIVRDCEICHSADAKDSCQVWKRAEERGCGCCLIMALKLRHLALGV